MFNKLKYIVICATFIFVNSAIAKGKQINAELTIQSDALSNDRCYYDDQAYSRGALISTNVNNKSKQLKCTSINDYELNGAVGWVEVGGENTTPKTNKIMINKG